MKTLTNVFEVEGILETKPAGVEAKPRYHWDYAAKISTQRRSQWSGCPTTSSVEDVPNVFGWPPSDSKRNSRQMVDGSCPKKLGDPTITLFLFHSFHWFDGNFGANVDIFMWGLILKHVLCFSSYQLEATKTLIGAFVWRTSTPSLPRALQMKNPNQKQVMRTLTWDSKRQESPWHRQKPAKVWGKAQNSRCDHHSDCGDQHYLLCGGREAFSDKPKQGDVTWGAGRERKATPNVRRWELDLRVSKSNSVQTQTSIFHFSNFEDKTKVLDNNQQLRHRNFSAKQPMKTRLLSSGLNPKMRWYLKLGFHFSMNFHQYEFLNTFFVIVNLSFFFCFWANQTLFLAVCCTSKVVLEEQTSQGPADSNPMTLFELVLMLERKGILDTKITGHGVDRPPSVKRGEETDRLEVVHESYSLFKPNAVTIKTAKSTNIAGLAGYKVLSASNYLVLVWRLLEHH